MNRAEEIEEAILDELDAYPWLTPSEIAQRVGCSVARVLQVKAQHEALAAAEPKKPLAGADVERARAEVKKELAKDSKKIAAERKKHFDKTMEHLEQKVALIEHRASKRRRARK